jgi:NAD(P)-dependent dehydrogenase (short-subunit alcohol dehydrogenase family)
VAADEILERIGKGIGIAGTGLSGCGDVIGLEADVTDRASIRAALEDVILAYGGLDHVIVTAGVYISSDSTGQIPDSSWEESFRVNVTGSYLLADEAHTIWQSQELPGCLVVTTSVNAVVPKAGSPAYDASKAAANHLVRELALKLAPLVRVNGVAPATVVAGSAMFPRDRVLASLAKYGLPHEETEATDTLKQRLADFYAERTLTRRAITPHDQAEAIFLLVSDRLGKTTGQIINVDGGLPEAFLR